MGAYARVNIFVILQPAVRNCLLKNIAALKLRKVARYGNSVLVAGKLVRKLVLHNLRRKFRRRAEYCSYIGFKRTENIVRIRKRSLFQNNYVQSVFIARFR